MSINIWDLETGSLVKNFNFKSKVTSLAITPDKENLIFGCDAGNVRVHKVDNGKMKKVI
jgi:hypothetical protein